MSFTNEVLLNELGSLKKGQHYVATIISSSKREKFTVLKEVYPFEHKDFLKLKQGEPVVQIKAEHCSDMLYLNVTKLKGLLVTIDHEVMDRLEVTKGLKEVIDGT